MIFTRLPHKINVSFIRNASTIFSLSSGKGKCGVSVIRVSGPQTMTALKSIVGPKYNPTPRQADLKSFKSPLNDEKIDKGLVLWFPGPFSFTGEDSCEFQVHGSIAVISAMLDALGRVPGLRQAKPGEFTKRAFFGGKLDLTEVDGLADLIHSETEAQRKQALLQSSGSLSRLYHNWRKRLIRSIAHLEAFIDFSEDDNIEDNVIVELNKELRKVKKEIKCHLDDSRRGELVRDGIKTVIVGEPNVGKSSFMNLMCQRNVSIVTDIAGTTRDLIETTFNISGFPVIFTDTAGLRKESQDVVEKEGIDRALGRMTTADLILLMVDSRDLRGVEELEDFKKKLLKKLKVEGLEGTRIQIVANKIDLLEKSELDRMRNLSGVQFVSCKEEINLKGMLDDLTGLFNDICGEPTAENPRLSQARYRNELKKCIEFIDIFLEDYNPEGNPDMAIAAQKLRQAVKCIERITGDVSTDEILDVVFRDFCIGK
ncbi:GTPBP3 family protein [Megaselia abdita]